MSNTVITSVGLNEVNRSFPSAPLFGIKYFVPVYDYRIDSDVNTGMTSAINYLSTISATSAQAYPTGEIIWNSNTPNTYTISQKYIVASGTPVDSGVNKLITAYVQSSVGVGANLSAGYPLTTSYTATTIYPPSISQNYWTLSPIESFSTVNGVGYISASNMRNFMWQTSDYYPVDDGTGHIQGAFKCNINNSIGVYKFNKIALYITRYKSDGSEDISELPKFFAEAYVNDVSVKSDQLTDGFSSIVMDVRLDFNSYGVISNSGFYANSANDWTLTTSGIYYPQRIGIGSFNNSLNAPQAQIHVRPTTIESDAIRIDCNLSGDTNFHTVAINRYNDLIISASISGAVSATNIKCQQLSATYIGSSTKAVTLIKADEIRVDTLSANSADFITVSSDLTCGDVTVDNIGVSTLIDANHVTAYDITANSIDSLTISASNLLKATTISATTITGSTIKAPILSASNALILSDVYGGITNSATVSYSNQYDTLTLDVDWVSCSSLVGASQLKTPAIYTDEINAYTGFGDVKIFSNMVPDDSSYSLGLDANRWGSAYINTINCTSLSATASINCVGLNVGTGTIETTGDITGNDITANNDVIYKGMVRSNGQLGTCLTSGTGTTRYISLKKESNFYDINLSDADTGSDTLHGIAKADNFKIGDVVYLSNSNVAHITLTTAGGAATNYYPFSSDQTTMKIGESNIKCGQFVFNGSVWLAVASN